MLTNDDKQFIENAINKAFSAALAPINQRLDAIEQRLDRVEQRLDRIEHNVTLLVKSHPQLKGIAASAGTRPIHHRD